MERNGARGGDRISETYDSGGRGERGEKEGKKGDQNRPPSI